MSEELHDGSGLRTLTMSRPCFVDPVNGFAARDPSSSRRGHRQRLLRLPCRTRATAPRIRRRNRPRTAVPKPLQPVAIIPTVLTEADSLDAAGSRFQLQRFGVHRLTWLRSSLRPKPQRHYCLAFPGGQGTASMRTASALGESAPSPVPAWRSSTSNDPDVTNSLRASDALHGVSPQWFAANLCSSGSLASCRKDVSSRVAMSSFRVPRPRRLLM